MPVEEELAAVSPKKDMFLTIGVFDGVHLGHKYLISQLTEQAKQQNLLSGVVTFRQHPRKILSPRTKLPYLTTVTEKISLLKNEGVDTVISLSFTRELAELSARQFASLLKKHLRMRGMIIGPDFTLGRNKVGNADILRVLGQDMDFSVTVIAPVRVNNEPVSSTAIRDALADGDMKRVSRLMGRYFSLQGKVTRGAGRGSRLGFPTANLDIDSKQALPTDGIYATWAYIDGKAHQSMTNIGLRPTFAGNKRTVETYVLNYDANLYGREIKIDVVERLRGEKRFDTVEELKKQMAEDVKQGIVILKTQSREQVT
ncbi:bifunctional riboflavin kinase/FAD synthetase [Chloroflexota bacterium]